MIFQLKEVAAAVAIGQEFGSFESDDNCLVSGYHLPVAIVEGERSARTRGGWELGTGSVELIGAMSQGNPHKGLQSLPVHERRQVVHPVEEETSHGLGAKEQKKERETTRFGDLMRGGLCWAEGCDVMRYGEPREEGFENRKRGSNKKKKARQAEVFELYSK